MARGEGEPGIKSHFVERVVKLPMVHVAWDYAANTYTHIKESNKLVNFTLTNAEKSVTFVAGQAKPVVLKFEKQIQAVDNLACLGLGTLEKKVPLITKPADEIIDDTRKLYTSTVFSQLENIKKLSNDTVKSAADFGLKQATAIFGPRMVQSVLSSVDGVLVVTQNYLDYVLPPTEAEKRQNNVHEDESKDKVTPLTRLTRITNTVRRRAYKSLQLKVEYIQEKTIDVFVVYPFTVIELTRTHLDDAIEYANKLWSAIMLKESDGKDDNSDKSRIEQQLLQLARLVSRQVAATYTSLMPPKTPSEGSTNNQEPSQSPAVLNAMRDRALWVFGMLRLIPQLLPMYVYGFVSWLNSKEDKTNESVKENGAVPKQNNHNSNHVQERSTEELTNSFEHSSDSSIPEEDEGGES